MRIGILANSLPAAANIYHEIKSVPGAEVFVLLSPADERSSWSGLVSQLARVAVKPGRAKTLKLISQRAVTRFSRPLHDRETISRVKEMKLDIGLHKSGNIYRRETIECFRLGILNAHIGLLPKYRGRSVMEWSLLQGDPIGISVFFVDEGIDTGRSIVLSETVDVSHCKTIAEAKQHLFDQDARVYRRAIEQLAKPNTEFQINDGSGRRYYVMSRLFQDVAQQCLAISNRQSEIGNI
jgi:methionyl-tRNA formyltransferase